MRFTRPGAENTPWGSPSNAAVKAALAVSLPPSCDHGEIHVGPLIAHLHRGVAVSRQARWVGDVRPGRRDGRERDQPWGPVWQVVGALGTARQKVAFRVVHPVA